MPPGVLMEDDAECPACGEPAPVLLTPHLTVLIDEHGACHVTTVEVPPMTAAARFRAARDWYYREGASSWEADAFGHWFANCTAPSQYRTYPDAVPEWNYGAAGGVYRRAHGRRRAGDGWTYGQPLISTGPIGASS